MMIRPFLRWLLPAVALVLVIAVHAENLDAFFADQTYDPEIPTVEEITGFKIGQRALTHAQIVRCIETWADSSKRVVLRNQGFSHEGRSLNHLIISSPENLKKLDEVEELTAQFSSITFSEQSEVVDKWQELPAVAFYSYSIHGDECSASDGALMFIYHLLASNSREVKTILSDSIIIVNPLQNPDGRDRYLKMIAESRSDNPSFDDQDLIPRAYWSRGRTNHYLFDLNRDWLFGVHPETQGLMKIVNRWNPLMAVDGHEMYPQDTYLFSPPVDPMNPNRPKWLLDMGYKFSEDQAAAFDAQNWFYYTGEWDEEWYPGYTTSWTALRGSLPILYEQARVAEGSVAHANGTKTSYRDTVEHQFLSSLTNLKSFHKYRKELKDGFLKQKLASVSDSGPYAKKAFIFPKTGNKSRLNRLLHTLKVQGITAYTNANPLQFERAVDRLGNPQEQLEVEAGAIIIPCKQPLAHLVAAMFQFDPAFPEPAAREEREKLLREGKSNIYDITAWNLGMAYDLPCYETDSYPGESGLELVNLEATHMDQSLKSTYAHIASGADDNSVVLAGRLAELGLQVRISDKNATIGSHKFPRGSVLVAARDNRNVPDYLSKLESAANALGVSLFAIESGKAESESTDLGGSHYILLKKPKVALLARGNTSLYSVGSTWYLLDKILGIKHSLLNEENLLSGRIPDLRRYEVIIIPERFGALPGGIKKELKQWVENGGTLIAMGASVYPFIDPESQFASTRQYTNVLEELDAYELDIQRSFEASVGVFPDYNALLSYSLPDSVEYPSSVSSSTKRPSKALLERKYQWQRLFAPSGSMLAARCDTHHWLAYGLGEYVPVLLGRDPLMLSKLPVETPIRFGTFYKDSSSSESSEKPGNVGWATTPDGYGMNLRMSGLLWPEGADMIANSSYLTREGLGKGQIILFANNPTFRNSTLGTSRMLMNAIIYGPGFGTRSEIEVF